MTHYMVVTPEYGTTIPILDDGSGPMEYGCDVVHVTAPNARQARVLAVRQWRKHGSGWLDDADGCPFTGLKVFNMDLADAEFLQEAGYI